jgi:hypothetical protein
MNVADSTPPFPPHICFYSDRLIWGDWTRSGPFAERLARRVPVCDVCGRQRPALRPRPPVRREARAEAPETPPLADLAGRTVAAVLLRRAGAAEDGVTSAPGLLSAAARRGVPASVAEEWIEHFLRAGWIEARWLVGRGGNRLDAVILRDGTALQEIAHPGAEMRRRFALNAARAQVAFLTHPKAREIASLLAADEAAALPPELVRALAAVAAHADADEVLAERVFSARWLGDSKALAGVRGRLERLVGPLAEIGIREGAAVTLLGGRGALHLPGLVVALEDLPPFAGFAHDTLERAREVLFPPAGLLVVENLAVFEACCRGEVPGTGPALIVWSAGYPGRTVRRLVERAGAAGAPVRVWADLDLDGVRIARLVVSWAPEAAVPWRMSPAAVAAAPAARLLGPRALSALRREVTERPGALLSDTLAALLEARHWIEQEVFLGASAEALAEVRMQDS